jgi:hypothetical protein
MNQHSSTRPGTTTSYQPNSKLEMSSSSTTFTLTNAPVLEWPERVPTPVLRAAITYFDADYQTARHREGQHRATVHAAMIAQGTYTFGETVQSVLQSFANQEPNRAGSPTPSVPYVPRSPTPELIPSTSPEPLPVLPRFATPFPDNLSQGIEFEVVAVELGAPFPDDQTDPLPNYEEEPPRYTAQRSPSPSVRARPSSWNSGSTTCSRTAPCTTSWCPTGKGV